MERDRMEKKKQEQSLTFEASTSTLPSSLLSAVDDWHTNNARNSFGRLNDKPHELHP